MDERGANIDLLFRNGLKDYEVLPPAGVWDGIRPALKKKSRMVIFYRIAAMSAILISLGFFASMLSRQNRVEDSNDLASLSIERSNAFRFPSAGQVLRVTGRTESESESASALTGEDLFPQNSVAEDNSPSITPEIAATGNITLLSENKIRDEFRKSEVPAAEKQSEASSLKPEIPAYFPELKPIVTERWSIAAMASPTYYSRFGNTQAKTLMSTEQPVISYSGGVAVSYKISKRLSVQTGVYYASLGQEVSGINSFSGFGKYFDTKGSNSFAVSTSSGEVFATNPDVFLLADGQRVQTSVTRDIFDPQKANLQPVGSNLIQNFSYLQMPVVLKYKVIDRSLDFNLTGGMSYDFLIGNSVYANSGGSKYEIGSTQGLNQFTLSSSLGMGMEYSFSKKVSMNLEPTFRYYLNPFSESAGLKIHPYSFGIFSGFSYRF